jgi:signal transduction histidine kinase
MPPSTHTRIPTTRTPCRNLPQSPSSRQHAGMNDSAREPDSTWLTGRAERLSRLSARHPFASDLAISLATATLSIGSLITRHHLPPFAVIFSVALCMSLLLRRLSPALCFGVIALVALAQWLLSGPLLADASVLIALYWVALEGRPAEVALAAATVELGAIMAAVRWSTVQPLKAWVGLSGLAVAAGVLGVTIRQRRALLLSLHEKAARLEVERDQEGRLGAAAERARIAREMHDIVAHNLSVMIALADGATYTMSAEPERAAQATARVSATGREALVEMRRLLGVLREDSSEQPLAPQPSLDRLDELLARVNAAGIPVSMELDGDPRELADGVQLTVFRVAQEALTNTLKHADRPTRAHLALSCRPGEVELDVTDTGNRRANRAVARLPATDGGRGLHGMRERASAYGGKLEAGPTPDGGWRVHLRLAPDAETAAR